jgi:hypothetical protein
VYSARLNVGASAPLVRQWQGHIGELSAASGLLGDSCFGTETKFISCCFCAIQNSVIVSSVTKGIFSDPSIPLIS